MSRKTAYADAFSDYPLLAKVAAGLGYVVDMNTDNGEHIREIGGVPHRTLRAFGHGESVLVAHPNDDRLWPSRVTLIAADGSERNPYHVPDLEDTPNHKPENLHSIQIGINVYRFGAYASVDTQASLLSGYAVVRFMDWLPVTMPLGINGWIPQSLDDWLDAETGDGRGNWYEQGCMVHPLSIAQLAQDLDVLPWVCIPHRFSREECQAAVRYLGAIFRDGVIVEFSNEVWNSSFLAHHECVKFGGGGDWLAGLYHAADMTVAMKETAGENVQIALGCWANNQWATEQVLARAEVARAVDALAIAPYFGHKAESLEAARLSLDDVKARVIGYRELASQHEIKLWCYEAGQHIETNSAELNNSAEMGTLYRQYYQMLAACGVDMACDYALLSHYDSTAAWGKYAVKDGVLSATPKLAALRELLKSD